MSNKLLYNYSNNDVKLYRDIYIPYIDILSLHLGNYDMDPDIVKLMDGELINVNRAPLVIIKRTHSPQPPTIALLNGGLKNINDTNYFSNKAQYYFNISIICYGNTYLEAERLGGIIQEALLSTSISKISTMSEGNILGHELLNWSETVIVSNDTKLFTNQIDIRVSILFETLSEV